MKTMAVKYLRSAAPRAYYHILLNAFGLNVARAVVYNFLWRCRRLVQNNILAKDPLIAELDREGIIVIENFLPEDQFREILDVYNGLQLDDRYKDKPNVPQYAAKQVSSSLKCEEPKVEKYIIDNERLKLLVEATSHRKINVFPKITFERFYATDKSQLMQNSPDRADALHYDVPFNSMRAFLYLKPCNDRNAAFVYGKRTHAFSKKRLKFEYYDSIKQSVKRSAIKCAPLDEIDNDLLEEIGHTPTDMVGNANTLVIFNSMGMHKRGQFKEIGAREALLIDYRTLDTPLNFWAGLPLIKKVMRKAVAQ